MSCQKLGNTVDAMILTSIPKQSTMPSRVRRHQIKEFGLKWTIRPATLRANSTRNDAKNAFAARRKTVVNVTLVFGTTNATPRKIEKFVYERSVSFE
jgi:hypothetical protein